jgi:hypothetical protein
MSQIDQNYDELLRDAAGTAIRVEQKIADERTAALKESSSDLSVPPRTQSDVAHLLLELSSRLDQCGASMDAIRRFLD